MKEKIGVTISVLVRLIDFEPGASREGDLSRPKTLRQLRDSVRRDLEWLLHGRTEGETRFSPLARINPQTVKDLGLAWSFATETTRGLEATPIVSGAAPSRRSPTRSTIPGLPPL